MKVCKNLIHLLLKPFSGRLHKQILLQHLIKVIILQWRSQDIGSGRDTLVGRLRTGSEGGDTGNQSIYEKLHLAFLNKFANPSLF